MTTLEKSVSLWLLGGVAGAVVGGVTGASAKAAIGGAALGAILVGAVGDSILERDQIDQPLVCDYRRPQRPRLTLAMR